MDYIGIYVLIAGSYTPLAWNLLRGRWRTSTIIAAWGVAASGIAVQLAFPTLPTWVPTLIYLAMGWGAIVCYLEIAHRLSHRPLRALLLGGVLYTAGAIINLAGWPALWPGVFGAHELFHLFAMGGSLCHFWFMMSVVAPFVASERDCPKPDVPCPVYVISERNS